jgi:hypothetical protein
VAYQITAVPTVVVIDRDRRIAETLEGEETWARLDRTVARLVGGS